MKIWILRIPDGDVLFFKERPRTRKGYLNGCSIGILPIELCEALVGKLEMEVWDQEDSLTAYENCKLPRYADIEEAVEVEIKEGATHVD